MTLFEKFILNFGNYKISKPCKIENLPFIKDIEIFLKAQCIMAAGKEVVNMNGKFNRLARVMLAKNDLKRALDSIGITSAVMRIDEDELIDVQVKIHSWIDRLGELEKEIAGEISTKEYT